MRTQRKEGTSLYVPPVLVERFLAELKGVKQLGIVIVTHKSERHIGPLLESLAQTTDPTTCEIWIWDNASPDATVAVIERESARIGLALHFIRSDKNVGFTRANNEVHARLIEESPCENIVLLNPDTVAHPGWWQPLVEALRDPAVGTAASLLLLPDGTINSRGNGLHFLGLGFVQGYGESVAQLSREQSLFSGSGAALAFRPDILAEVNRLLGVPDIFWAELFIYAEDTDLGWRMRMVGRENRFVPASRITHDHRFWLQASGESGDRFFYLEQNRYLLMLANYKIATLLLLLPGILSSEIILALGIRKLYRHRLQLWRAVWSEAGTKRFLARRQRLQAGRTVGDREILRAMTGSIRHGAIPHQGFNRGLDAASQACHRLLVFLVRW